MKIQLKRSVVLENYGAGDEAKRPTAAQMLDGELAVNYNANDPAIFIKDSTGAIVRIAGNNSIGGDQDLGYTADTDKGTVTISDGTDAIIPLADDTNAGLFTATEKDKLTNISANAGVDQNLGYTPNGDNAGSVTIERGTNATIPIAIQPDSGASPPVAAVAGLFTGAEKLKLANLNTNSQNDLVYVQVAGDTMTGTLTIDNTTDDENALVTGAGHDIVLGSAANIVFDNTNDTTIQANTLAGDNVLATLPAASGILTTEPTADGIYLRKLAGTALTWVSVSDDTDGVVTSITAGDGIDIDDTDPNAPEISVDLAANQGLQFTSAELAVIPGSNAQDTLLWTITGGAQNIAGGASGATTEPEGDYTNVATSGGNGSGCTVNFSVAADGTISNLAIASPGSGYDAGDTLTISGHQTADPAAITFTLDTAGNDGVYTYTGWRTGALGVSGGSSGGDLTAIDGGPGIVITEADTTTPKVGVDLTLNGGLVLSDNTDAATLGVQVHNGLEVTSNGISTRIHTGGGLSDTLNTNELGLIDGSASNQILVWKGANRVNTVDVAGAPNNVSDQPEGSYTGVGTTDTSGTPGSGLTVRFTVGAGNVVTGANVENPGSGYTNGVTVSVNGHADLQLTITAITADAEWVVESFNGGGGSGGGDVTNVLPGAGIDVDTSAGPDPRISADVSARGGLNNNVAGVANADDGELGMEFGSNANDIMIWRAVGTVTGIDITSLTGDGPIGVYSNLPTTNPGGSGTGLVVDLVITIEDDVSSGATLTVVNPGSGYTTAQGVINVAVPGGGTLVCTITDVTTDQRWLPGSLESATNINGVAGHWTRDDSTDTLSPRLANDNVDIGTGAFTGSTVNAGTLTNTNTLVISTTDNNGNIDINANGSGEVQINTDVVIEAQHALELVDNSSNSVSHRAAASLGADVTYDWPVAPTVSGQILSSTNAGTLSWLNYAEMTVDSTPPSPAVQGQLWWNTDVGRMFIYYIDGDSTEQWVETSPSQDYLYWERTGTSVHPVTNTDSVFVGASGGSGAIELNADGTSEFTGEMSFVNNLNTETVSINNQSGDITTSGDLDSNNWPVISTNTTYYVATTGDDATGDGSSANPWATPHQALRYLSAFILEADVLITIEVAAGEYTFTEPLVCSHSQGTQIEIYGAATTGTRPTGDAAAPFTLNGGAVIGNTAATESYNDTLLRAHYSTIFQFNGCDGLVASFGGMMYADRLYIRGNGSAAAMAHGVKAAIRPRLDSINGSAHNAASCGIRLGNSVAIHNFRNTGISAWYGGVVVANNVTVTNSVGHNIRGDIGGYVVCRNATSSNADATGILSHGSFVQVSGCISHYNTRSCLTAVSSGLIEAEDSILNNCTEAAVQVSSNSTVLCSRAVIQNSGSFGIWAQQGSEVTAESCNISDNGGGANGLDGACIALSNTTFTDNASSALRISNGGSIRCNDIVISGTHNEGVRVSGGGFFWGDGMDISECTNEGILISNNGTVIATNLEVDDCLRAVRVIGNGVIYIPSAIITNSRADAVMVESSGTIRAGGADISGTALTFFDLNVQYAGEIQIDDTTVYTTTTPAVDTVGNGNGYIFET